MKFLSDSEEKILKEYIDEVRNLYAEKIVKIVLFGSKARGESHAASDLDILFIIDSQDRNLKNKIIDLSWDTMFKYDFSLFISPIVFFRKEYEKFLEWNSSFLKNVSKDGILL